MSKANQSKTSVRQQSRCHKHRWLRKFNFLNLSECCVYLLSSGIKNSRCAYVFCVFPAMYSVFPETLIYEGRDNSAGIATRCGLECPRIQTRLGRYFLQPSRLALGSLGLLYNCYRLSFPRVKLPRLKKGYSYNSTPRLGLLSLF
jgi:hypothetical protein